jgi:hypothetical protein
MKEIYIVFGEDDCAFCCSNRDTLWQKLSELFGGARVRLNPTAIDDYIDFFDEYTHEWCSSNVHYEVIRCYGCDE